MKGHLKVAFLVHSIGLFATFILMNLTHKFNVLFTAIFFISATSYGQIDIGAGLTMAFPLSYNKAVGNYNHSSGSPGARFQLNYVKPEATFIPSFSFTYGQWLLPVQKFGVDKVLSMKFNTMSFTISGMVRKVLENKKEFIFGPGIGMAVLKGKGVNINGKPELINSVIEDSSAFISSITPYAMFSGEYIMPVTSDAPVYLGIGAQIQYTYFFSGDRTYRVDIVDNQLQYYQLTPELSGHMVNPAVYAVIYYRFGER